MYINIHANWVGGGREQGDFSKTQKNIKNANYLRSKPSLELSFHLCFESSHLQNFPARLLLLPHSLAALQVQKKKAKQHHMRLSQVVQRVNYFIQWIQNWCLHHKKVLNDVHWICHKLWTTKVSYDNYKFIYNNKLDKLLICQAFKGEIRSLEITTNRAEFTTDSTCNHKWRQTKLVWWIYSLPTQSFNKNNIAILLKCSMFYCFQKYHF